MVFSDPAFHCILWVTSESLRSAQFRGRDGDPTFQWEEGGRICRHAINPPWPSTCLLDGWMDGCQIALHLSPPPPWMPSSSCLPASFSCTALTPAFLRIGRAEQPSGRKTTG